MANRTGRFGVVETIAIAVLIALVVAVTFPMWWPRPHWHNARLTDGAGFPLMNLRIQVTGKSGWEWTETDQHGGFDVSPPYRVQGFILGSTIGKKKMYAPQCDATFRFVATGRASRPNLEGAVMLRGGSMGWSKRTTDGVLRVSHVAANSQFEVRAADIAHWKVSKVRRFWEPGLVSFVVTLEQREQPLSSGDPAYGWFYVPGRVEAN